MKVNKTKTSKKVSTKRKVSVDSIKPKVVKETPTNHYIFVVDTSSSMALHGTNVKKYLNEMMSNAMTSCHAEKQKCLITVFEFNNTVKILVDNHLGVTLPVLPNLVFNNNTALRDAIVTALDINSTDKNTAFLLNLITDGEENASRLTQEVLTAQIDKVQKLGNWTLCATGPASSVTYLNRLGFPTGNLVIWDGKEDIKNVSAFNKEAMIRYVSHRGTGGQSMSNYYADLSAVKGSNLKILDNTTNDFTMFTVDAEADISSFVQSKVGKYNLGDAYYELIKTETIQPSKDIAVFDPKNGNIYSGSKARALLNLPNNNCKITPKALGGYSLFIQSTSVNRKLLPGTRILVKD